MTRATHSSYMQHAKHPVTGFIRLDASGVPAIHLDEQLRDELEEDLRCDPTLSLHGHYGYPPLLEAIAEKCDLASTDGVVMAAGSSMGNHLVMAALLEEPGDGVLIEQPAYPLLVETARYLRADVRRLPRDPGGELCAESVRGTIERERLDRLRLIVLTNPHNPTGALLDEASLREIGQIAEEHGARVLVDEVYLDMVFEGPPRSAFHLGPTFITTNSLTKAYGLSGLRCGWILAEPQLARRLWHLTDLFDVNPPHIAERLSVIALRHLPELRERAHSLLTENRRLLNEFLKSRDDLDAPIRPFGSISFPRLPGTEGATLCRILRAHYSTLVTDGAFFDAPQHVRIAIGAATPDVREGLLRLGLALDASSPPRG